MTKLRDVLENMAREQQEWEAAQIELARVQNEVLDDLPWVNMFGGEK